jgi:hypothetical protein
MRRQSHGPVARVYRCVWSSSRSTGESLSHRRSRGKRPLAVRRTNVPAVSTYRPRSTRMPPVLTNRNMYLPSAPRQSSSVASPSCVAYGSLFQCPTIRASIACRRGMVEPSPCTGRREQATITTKRMLDAHLIIRLAVISPFAVFGMIMFACLYGGGQA